MDVRRLPSATLQHIHTNSLLAAWPVRGWAPFQFNRRVPNGLSVSSRGDSDPAPARPAVVTRVAQWSPAQLEPPGEGPSKRLPVRVDPGDVPEAHKVFDEVVVVVRGGHGGNGEVVTSGRGRYVPNNKFKPGGNQPKQIWLPSSDPGDGADGGDVVLVCDPGVDSLLHLHPQARGGAAGARGGGGKGGSAKGMGGAALFCAPDGSNANPNTGSLGPKRNKEIKKARTPALEIPVPPGTVVKKRGSGALLGELLQPGDRLTVVRGGGGGHGVVAPSRQLRQARASRAEREAQAKGVELVEVEDEGWKRDSRGQPGQQLSLTLLLRVVADVGLVGFPNAGKSSLLKALTRASPTIAPYPFTTLMPNLGVLSAGGGATKAVLADLPGLIEGAHKGRGLGRNFLRHLRRTRALLHVVDAAAPDPATDYYAVREELRMYNPEYCVRPHVVALNKTDLLAAAPGSDTAAATSELVSFIRSAAARQASEHCELSHEGPAPLAPLAVVPCSAATGEGLRELAAALQKAIGASYISEPDIVRPAPDTLAAARSPGSAAATATAVATGGGAVAVAAAVAAAAASSPSGRRTQPPPPPTGWDDDDSSSWGATGSNDDAASELAAGELELFAQRCRHLGLMDEQGNLTGMRVDEQAGAAELLGEQLLAAAGGAERGSSEPTEGGEEEAVGAEPLLRKIHDTLDEQEQSYLDEHLPAAAGNGDADDEWVDLSTLDEATLAAVLEELEQSGHAPWLEASGEAAAATTAPSAAAEERSLLDWRLDVQLQEEEKEPVQEKPAATRGSATGAGATKEEDCQEGEEGEGLVRMAGLDDPDARLVGLSLEELLAMEKDW